MPVEYTAIFQSKPHAIAFIILMSVDATNILRQETKELLNICCIIISIFGCLPRNFVAKRFMRTSMESMSGFNMRFPRLRMWV